MKKRIGLISIIVMLNLIFIVSGEVIFSQPNEVYNFGENINLNVNINPIENKGLEINLICNGKKSLIFYDINPKEKFNLNLPLNPSQINNLYGKCKLIAVYNEKSYESRSFEISNKLHIRLSVESIFAKPGESITISGIAERLNKKKINGNVKITIPNLKLKENSNKSLSKNIQTKNNLSENINFSNLSIKSKNSTKFSENLDSFNGIVKDGKFSISFKLNKNTPAGEYEIDLSVNELDSAGNKLNVGTTKAKLNIKSILNNIEVILKKQNFDPGENLSFKPLLLDQSGKEIKDKVSIIIYDENNNRIYEKLVNSGELIKYQIPTNLSFGYYTIEASSGNLTSTEKIYINEKEIVSFNIIDDLLVVTNIGNTIYNKDFQIEMNGKPFIKKLYLNLGESKEFKLTGNGDYNIKINKGEFQKKISLTGNAVNVKPLKNNSKGLNVIVVWIFFIIILGVGILFLFKNILKKKSFAYPIKNLENRFEKKFSKKKDKILKINDTQNLEKNSGELKKIPIEEQKGIRSLILPKEAEQVLVLHGQKNSVGILVLKIKNKIDKKAKTKLEEILNVINDKKGVIYKFGEYIIGIFSPLTTRTFKNEVEATKVAEIIEKLLKEYNRGEDSKIEFGIVIGSGEIINKIEGNKLKFTPLGDFFNNTKKISEFAENKILITKEAFEKNPYEIKTDKKNINEIEVYEFKRLVDSEKNQKFIEGFLDRMKKQDN